MQIYLITNTFLTPHMYYVGQTTGCINDRMLQHIRMGIREGNRELGKALQYYGTMNFKIELLEVVEDVSANYVETMYMRQYNCLHPHGYNMKEQLPKIKLLLTGEDQIKKDENIGRGLSWNTGIEMSKYISKKISLSIEEKKKQGWINPSHGHSHSNATKEKISIKKKEYFKEKIAYNAKTWKITSEQAERYTNTLEREMGKKMYNRISKWSRENKAGLHPKLKMRVDHVH